MFQINLEILWHLTKFRYRAYQCHRKAIRLKQALEREIDLNLAAQAQIRQAIKFITNLERNVDG